MLKNNNIYIYIYIYIYVKLISIDEIEKSPHTTEANIIHYAVMNTDVNTSPTDYTQEEWEREGEGEVERGGRGEIRD